jgi:hypothetical protein
MPNSPFLSSILKDNYTGLVSCIERFKGHDGLMNLEHLHCVQEKDGKLSLAPAGKPGQKMPGILVGAEVCNSFTPIYEFSGFCRALFLAGVITACTDKAGYTEADAENILAYISEDQLKQGIAQPRIAMVVDLDTDIEPYRYIKHQLWGIPDDSLSKNCHEITAAELRQERSVLGQGDYWIPEDENLTQIACQNATSLPEAKAFQYYLFARQVLTSLEINVDHIPLYFNFVPKTELLKSGPEGEFIKILLAMHERQSLALLGKLVQTRTPWILSFSCPQCHESSKRIINAKVSKKNLMQTVLHCSNAPKKFRNEKGMKIIRSGCGHRWIVEIPCSPNDLFTFLNENSFSINCAVRELIRVLNSGSGSPICYSASNIGVSLTGNNFSVLEGLPAGYGDHRKLMTSVLAMQRLLVKGKIATSFQRKSRLVSREIQLLIAARGEGELLVDPEIRCIDNPNLHVTDTSALKLLQIMDIKKAFRLAVDVNEITLNQLLSFRGLNWDI